MKTIQELIKKHLNLFDPIRCDPEQEILHVMANGQKHLEFPKRAKDVVCPLCGKDEGFYIPHGKTWSCCNEECIFKNAGWLGYGEKFYSMGIKYRFDISCYKCFPHLEEYERNRNLGIISSIVDYSKHGIEKHLEHASFKDCHQSDEIQKKFKDCTLSKRGITILSGKNGIGKTYMSVCAMKEFVKRNASCRFISFPKMRMEWLEIKRASESELSFLESLCNCDFLVLDDMGLTTPTESFLDFVYLLLDRRHQPPKTTIITTNLTGKEVIEKFGEAIFSRIASGHVFKMEGKDKRINW